MDLINQFKKDSLMEYLTRCNQVIGIDIDKAYDLAMYAVKYYGGNADVRDNLRALHDLEAKWYDSLSNNSPDYSVYDDVSFLSDLWACWVVYSRQYLKTISSDKSLFGKSIVSDMENVNTVLDLGCGFGYTTGALKQLFPEADVFGTNIEVSCQYPIAQSFGADYDFTVIPSMYHVKKKVDLVFASEYFEHIEDATVHLTELLRVCDPTYLIIANAFGTKALGHFDFYTTYDPYTYMTAKETSRTFNKILKAHGYEKVKTKCWNDRPAYWRKISGGLFDEP